MTYKHDGYSRPARKVHRRKTGLRGGYIKDADWQTLGYAGAHKHRHRDRGRRERDLRLLRGALP